MRLHSCLLTAALALPGLAHANDLSRVFDLAVENDATIRAAQYQRDAAIEAKPQARAALLPQLNGAYDYGYTDSESTIKSDNPLIGGTTSNHGTDDTLSVNLSQSLFSLESWRRLQQASEQVALAQATYRNAEQNLVLRVANAYFGVLSADDTLRSAQAEKAAVERQLEQAKKRFEVGLSAITDVQEAQARYDLTVAQEIQAQQQLSSAREALTEITHEPQTSVATLQDDFPLPTPTPDDVDQWVAQALDGNIDLMAAQLGLNVAERGVQVARSKHLPTLGLTARYVDSSSESGSFPTDATQNSVGIGVTVPIFSGGAVRSGVRQATATREQRKAEYDGAQRSVERNTRDAFQGVVTGAAQVKAYKQAVVSSTTALEASETGLEVGARTAVDVLNAQQQLYAAQRNYLKSRYDYLISVLQLKAAAGKLTVVDLNEIDRLLINQ
jgi:outer membrane protein